MLIFCKANRMLTESMHVVMSRHPSLDDFKYINDVSSVLVEKQEPIYQELIRIEHLISTPPTDPMNDVDENKENRPPLVPIKYPTSRIPILTSTINNRNVNTSKITPKDKKTEELKKNPMIKPNLTGNIRLLFSFQGQSIFMVHLSRK